MLLLQPACTNCTRPCSVSVALVGADQAKRREGHRDARQVHEVAGEDDPEGVPPEQAAEEHAEDQLRRKGQRVARLQVRVVAVRLQHLGAEGRQRRDHEHGGERQGACGAPPPQRPGCSPQRLRAEVQHQRRQGVRRRDGRRDAPEVQLPLAEVVQHGLLHWWTSASWLSRQILPVHFFCVASDVEASQAKGAATCVNAARCPQPHVVQAAVVGTALSCR
mmetsp:Transcript_22413/g.46463  ORF Transcript_22413/g.46463 Transcript_22413/m.46463 type:complete len:220 (+) Transcript_22413:124-783(+)